jgi:hypothetical protein
MINMKYGSFFPCGCQWPLFAALQHSQKPAVDPKPRAGFFGSGHSSKAVCGWPVPDWVDRGRQLAKPLWRVELGNQIGRDALGKLRY